LGFWWSNGIGFLLLTYSNPNRGNPNPVAIGPDF
jgi:hypothetical protein